MWSKPKKCKPEESKTVRQWAILGRIPIDALNPSYIWETQTDGPVTVYYHKENTREMTEEEKLAFLADTKRIFGTLFEVVFEKKIEQIERIQKKDSSV